jgi:hypothetical protein
MKPNFTNLTDKELEEMKNALNTEINRRKEVEKELAREELAELLDRINELQYKYGFEISCEEDDGSWISSASEFQLSL